MKETVKTKKKVHIRKNKLFAMCMAIALCLSIMCVAVSAEEGETSATSTKGMVSGLLGDIGDGIGEFMPDVAEASVNTVETLFRDPVTGQFTILGTFTIIGIVLACGLGVLSIVKRRMNKV